MDTHERNVWVSSKKTSAKKLSLKTQKHKKVFDLNTYNIHI